MRCSFTVPKFYSARTKLSACELKPQKNVPLKSHKRFLTSSAFLDKVTSILCKAGSNPIKVD